MNIPYAILVILPLLTTAIHAQDTGVIGNQNFEEQTTHLHHNPTLSTDRAPGDVLVSDDFSDFSNWNIYNEDGTVPVWEMVTTTPSEFLTYMEAFESPTNANGFAAFNGIQYLLEGTVVPINALVEYGEIIDCSAATSLTMEFFMAYRAFNTDKVFVEVTNNGWIDGPGTVNYELFEFLPTNDPTEQETISIDISSIAAGSATVQVRFRFIELIADAEYGAGYGSMVDDFKIQEAWNYDQEITATYQRSGIGGYIFSGLEYYQIAESQITEINFSGKTQNIGALLQENAKLNVDITGAGTYSGMSASADLPVLASDSMFCETSFTPTDLGVYTIKYWFDSDNIEGEPNNDSIFKTIEVTENMYARDNGTFTSSIANIASNDDEPLLIGNVMDIFGDDSIGSIEIVISNDPSNIGKVIFGQLMLYDESEDDFIYLDQTENHTITSGENGDPITIEFDTPIEVLEGQTILVLAGHYGGPSEARFRMAQLVEHQTVLGYGSGETDYFALTPATAIMVRVRFGRIDYIGIDELKNADFSVKQNIPNPFTENSVITYELKNNAEVSVEFTDLTGKRIKSINLGLQSSGNYSIELNATEFAAGTYFYTFKINNTVLTKKMLVTN